jgi:predicted O-linked N-acetylglucosamine transferase (SPINDLY family)
LRLPTLEPSTTVKPESSQPVLEPDLATQLAVAIGAHHRGEIATAEARYREIVLRDPGCLTAWHLLGVVAVDRGELDAGIAHLQRALALDAASPDVAYALSVAHARRGDVPAALASLDRVTRLRAEHADAWYLRGNLLLQTGRYAESLACFGSALRSRPVYAEAFNSSASALRALRRLDRALECADRAIALRPDYALAHNMRGLVLLDLRQGAEAVASFRRALDARPDFAEALHNLGTAWMQLQRHRQAAEAFARLAAMAPQFPHVRGNLLHARLECADWRDYESDRLAVSEGLACGLASDTPMQFLCLSDSAPLQLRCARLYTATHYPAAPRAVPVRVRREGPIRIAYLSGDFGEHAVSYLLAGVFERHDRSRFETIALSWGRSQEGPRRQRLETAFGRFIDVSAQGDDEVVGLMESLGVDIAIDLGGHTLGQRTGILARRAAPIQVNFLGLPATMGAAYIDYLIADRHLIPEHLRPHYEEQVVWLPESFQPNDDRRGAAADAGPRGRHGLPATGLVLCCFNKTCKLNPPMFAVWMRLLQAIPEGVLWLLAADAQVAQRLRGEAAAHGVPPERLVFAPPTGYADYLARYTHADLFLDTWPFNGGATVSDALSMGVPVLTCLGESFSARMAGGLLASLELPELAAADLAHYEATALALLSDADRLARIRRLLAERREQHPFFDTDRYRRHLEGAYETMMARHAGGLAPAAFAVPAIDDHPGKKVHSSSDHSSRLSSGPT